jgi:EH domain-containing protein 3/EH domain-containing protein 1
MSQFPTVNPELGRSEKNPFQADSAPRPGEIPPSYWHFESIDKSMYFPRFQQLGPRDGKVSGADVKPVLMESGLPNDQLAQIWRLADFDNDGYMDIDEYCIAMHLIKAVQSEAQLPEKLPHTLMPTRKF